MAKRKPGNVRSTRPAAKNVKRAPVKRGPKPRPKAKPKPVAIEQPSPAELGTLAEIGNYRAVSERTVATWRKEGLPPPPLSREEVDAWCAANGKGRGKRSEASEHTAEFELLELRKKRAETELAEFAAGEKQKIFVQVKRVLAELLPFLATVRLVVEQLPNRLTPYFADANEGRAAARRECDNALSELADAAKALAALAPKAPEAAS